MTLQTLTIGKRKYVLLAKSDFDKLAAQAQRQSEDDYWTQSALAAEAKALAKGENPISLEGVERELDEQGRAGKGIGRRERR